MELLPCKDHEVLEFAGEVGVGRSSGRLKRGRLLNSVSGHIKREKIV